MLTTTTIQRPAHRSLITPYPRKPRGFTIVELLIVIVIIAILAAITVVAYRGMQDRAYKSRRVSDIALVVKAVEMYYVDNGHYPVATCLSTSSWNCWGLSGDTNRLVAVQYASTMPQDPQFLDSDACTSPNSHQSRMYAYASNADGSGYRIGTYIPGLAPSDPNYFDGSTDIGCLNFVNYLVRKNM